MVLPKIPKKGRGYRYTGEAVTLSKISQKPNNGGKLASQSQLLLLFSAYKWDSHVLVIDNVAPPNWKVGCTNKLNTDEPAGRILELCIRHLAMSEITVLETRHPVVINEAVDFAKRFCDGSAPRIINGCLRTFVKQIEEAGGLTPALGYKQKVVTR